MKTHSKFLLSILLLASCSVVAAAQEQKPDEVAALVSATRFLEQSPLDKKAKDVRSSAVKWVIETDKVTVSICANFLRAYDDKYKYGSELMGQYMLGMAAYKLSNPGKDEASVQLAGYESALLAYEAMVKQESKAKNSKLEALVAKRADGTLAQHVAENSCKEKK